jgi:hypothetical protein
MLARMVFRRPLLFKGAPSHALILALTLALRLDLRGSGYGCCRLGPSRDGLRAHFGDLGAL